MDSLPSRPNPYNYAGEYGAASTDVRHRELFGGTVNLRWNIRLNPLFTAQTGMPFNITTGEDNYNTTLFTARPAGVPRNSGRGPGRKKDRADRFAHHAIPTPPRDPLSARRKATAASSPNHPPRASTT